MSLYRYIITLLVTVAAYAAPDNIGEQRKAALVSKQVKRANNDLKTSSSSYSHQYSDWGGSYPGGYGFSVTGYGTLEDRSGFDQSYNTLGGYDNSFKNSYTGVGSSGFGGVTGYGTNIGSGEYKGYGGLSQSGYGASGYRPGGYGTSGFGSNAYGANGYGPSGYGTSGYGASSYGTSGYGSSGYGPSGYGPSGYGPSGQEGTSGYFNKVGYGVGNGGYGGYGGNGGLNSYYGYNNPSYQGAGHLGYGYYNKKTGHGNIYSSGVTPSLVTGYRGYTR